MKTLHEFADTLKAALAAIEGASAAEERAKAAQQAVRRAGEMHREIVERGTKAIADADSEVLSRKTYVEKIEAEHAQRWTAEKAEHDRYVANARAQVETASETLSALQLQIAEARKTRDEINAELAKLRAAFGESASKLGNG